MLIFNSLRKQFANVANPEKVFRKSFMIVASGVFIGSYATAGALAWDSIQTEWNRESFESHRLLPWVLAANHGANVIKAIAVSYIGDVAGIYVGTGALYWRNKRRKNTSQNPQQTLENL